MDPPFSFVQAKAYSDALPAHPVEAFYLELWIEDMLLPDPFLGSRPTSEWLAIEVINCRIFHIHYRVEDCIIHLLDVVQSA